MRQAHIVGAGLAGLAAALSLAAAGWRVTVYEAAPAAGGRCRSYFDRELGCRIDNGNHLLLSGNQAAFAYLEETGARASLTGPARPCFPFFDLATGARWTVRPSAGRVPWWLLRRDCRVPGTTLADALTAWHLLRAGPATCVAEVLRPGPLTRLLLEPLAISALNTRPEVASARLLAAVMRETLARGGAACIPAFPREGLSESFVDPALALLRARGATVHFARRVGALVESDGQVSALATAEGRVPVGRDDAVVLAVPPAVATDLLPGLDAPDRFEAILNLHFRIGADPGEAGFLGLVGGIAEWVFAKPGIVSVTISAANHLLDRSSEALAAQVWAELRRALALPEAMPAWRVVRERRATFAATPDQDRRRPSVKTRLRNLALAGDWTATGLPATIEGAIRSGRTAARACMR